LKRDAAGSASFQSKIVIKRMKALPTSPPPLERRKPEKVDSSAQAALSWRAVSALEIASVTISALIALWVIVPLFPDNRFLPAIPGLFALALMIHSHRVRRETARALGLTTEHFGEAARRLALPTLAAGLIFAGLGASAGSFHRPTHLWANIFFLPVWGLLQQYILQGFVYRRMRELLEVRGATIAAAALFALAHAPNLPLVALTFAGALIWTRVYQRAPNLFALGLSHAALSLVAMSTLPPWALESLSVGYKHFLYQRF
jgi:membrane protease YdiL (CAAX protease family)